MKKIAICFVLPIIASLSTMSPQLKTIMFRAISTILVVSSAMAAAYNWSPVDSFCLAFAGDVESQERMKTEMHQYPFKSGTADETPIVYKRVKKAIFCQNGTILHLKTSADDAKNHFSKRVLRKKSIIQRKIKPDEEKNQVIEDEKQDAGIRIINAIQSLFGKKKEPVQEKLPPSGEDTICGLSNNGIPYAILKNGDKIFKGGKLDNGCIVDMIADDYVILNCNGLKKKQNL